MGVSDAHIVPELHTQTLVEQNRVLEKKLAAALRENEWLRQRLTRYLRRMFGSKAEKIDLAQIKLPFDELLDIAAAEHQDEPSAAVLEAADDEEGTTTQKKRKGAHGRKPLPKDLPRMRVEIHPEEHERICTCCKEPLIAIGEEITEELDFQPATMTVTEHVRVQYACKRCEEGVVIAPLPPRVIEKGRPGPGLLAHILVSKYADHLPLHRLESIFERHGVELSRQTMCDWVAAASEPLSRIVAEQKKSVRASFTIHSDDTSLLCQENFSGAGKRRSFLWAYVGDRSEIVYDFTLSRERDGPERWLAGWEGYLQVDGYAGYNRLFASGKVIEVACWAHVRRKYFDALASDSTRASLMLALIQRLYRIESHAKELAPAERAALRREEATPILSEIRARIDEDARTVLPKTDLGEAVTYATNQWDALVRYVEDGRLDIDNNEVERALRCVAVGRKNWLFAGSPKGGERAAVIYSLVSTCKLLGIEPFAYLRDVLQRLPTHPRDRIAELTPRAWQAARAAAAAR
jgi:transposase